MPDSSARDHRRPCTAVRPGHSCTAWADSAVSCGSDSGGRVPDRWRQRAARPAVGGGMQPLCCLRPVPAQLYPVPAAPALSRHPRPPTVCALAAARVPDRWRQRTARPEVGGGMQPLCCLSPVPAQLYPAPAAPALSCCPRPAAACAPAEIRSAQRLERATRVDAKALCQR